MASSGLPRESWKLDGGVSMIGSRSLDKEYILLHRVRKKNESMKKHKPGVGNK